MRVLLLFIGTIVFFESLGQSRILSGTVVDSEGIPVPGVNILLKQTTNGVVSDIDGKFKLEVPANKKVKLVVSPICPSFEHTVRNGKNDIKIKVWENIQARRFYFLGGINILKLSNSKYDIGPSLSIGYQRHLNRFKLLGEVNLLSNRIQDVALNQFGVPLLSSLRLTNSISAFLGCGYYWAINKSLYNDDFKVITGLLFEKQGFGANLRWLNGFKEIADGESDLAKSVQLAVHIRIR